MIKAEKLSYSFPQKDLYNKISFTLEDDVHCAFIGTNGTGKSTLVDMILHPDNYLYDGRLIVDVPGRIGYVSQFYSLDEEKEVTVFDYLSEEFVRLQNEINTICDEMATADELDELMERYQNVMDQFQAIDGDFYESNIRKQLKIANLKDYENHLLTNLSGGEFKLIQVIREMMISPKFIIMDEPDVFLDFEHLNALKNLINSHKGTLLVITHNRYLLNHCFNKILHLENAELQEFDGTYVDYNFALLEMKIEQQELAAADMEEIERNRLPEGYTFFWDSQYKDQKEAMAALTKYFPLALIMLLVILVMLFGNFRQPLIIFLILPLSLIGMVFGLWVTGFQFGFFCIAGWLGLLGMIIKNVIVLLDEVNIQQKAGVEPYTAVIEATVSRARPVLLAALTTVFGLSFATLLTLFVTPALYTVFYKISKRGE